jgi:hypothetical protein
MILFTIMPLELVYRQEPEDLLRLQEIRQKEAILLVEPCGNGLGRVVRLISSSPEDYLRPEYQPGQELPIPLENSKDP